MYIFNLVLACWIMDDYNPREVAQFFKGKTKSYHKDLETAVKLWCKYPNESWTDIHPNCRVEHFELYETLPDNWDKICHIS